MLALVWVSLLLAGLTIGVRPRLRALDRLDADADSYAARAARADNGAAELTRLDDRLRAVRSTVDGEMKHIPPSTDAAEFIRALTSQLDTLGMSGREITTGATVDLDDAMSAPMTVRLRGPSTGVYQAIQWIESLPRLVRIVRVSIETPQRSADELLENAGRSVQAELLLSVYSDPKQKGALPVESEPIADGGER